jgi:hypothetical protein
MATCSFGCTDCLFVLAARVGCLMPGAVCCYQGCLIQHMLGVLESTRQLRSLMCLPVTFITDPLPCLSTAFTTSIACAGKHRIALPLQQKQSTLPVPLAHGQSLQLAFTWATTTTHPDSPAPHIPAQCCHSLKVTASDMLSWELQAGVSWCTCCHSCLHHLTTLLTPGVSQHLPAQLTAHALYTEHRCQAPGRIHPPANPLLSAPHHPTRQSATTLALALLVLQAHKQYCHRQAGPSPGWPIARLTGPSKQCSFCKASMPVLLLAHPT